MTLVRQPMNSNLCGQACVATITGISLNESIKLFGTRGCTTTKQVAAALHSMGYECGETCIKLKNNEKPKNGMCVLHFENCKFTHWVVFLNGLFYDPASGIGNEYDSCVRVTSYLPIKI